MIKLIYDCLRAPYDFANILQVVVATNCCELHITGSSMKHSHPKIMGKLKSWSNISEFYIPIFYYDTLEECVKKFKDENLRIIATSPHAKKSFFDLDLSSNDFAIVFGTESGGLSKSKTGLMDELVKIPMSKDLNFYTLSILTPVIVFECLRQQNKL